MFWLLQNISVLLWLFLYRLRSRLPQTLCIQVAQWLLPCVSPMRPESVAVSSGTATSPVALESHGRKSGGGDDLNQTLVFLWAVWNAPWKCWFPPLDQHDETVTLSAAVLGRCPGMCRGFWGEGATTTCSSHLPHSHLHQTHRLPTLLPAAQGSL